MTGRLAVSALLFAASALLYPLDGAAQSDQTLPQCRDVSPTPPAAASPHTVTAEDYPALSRTLNEEGKVMLDVAVQQDGTVGNVQVRTSSGSPRLDTAAVDLVKQRWTYKPVTINGAAVACLVQVNIVWQLQGTPFPVPPANSPMILMPMDVADYPAESRARHEQGTVVAMFVIGEDGKVVMASVLQSSGFTALDAKSIELVMGKWRPSPARLAGKPVKSVVSLMMVW